jgi:hypothetical protein
MYHDEFTGKYHTHFREFDPVHNRWLSEDPAGYADGLNLYAAYMDVNGVDPLGLDFVSINAEGQVSWTVESKWLGKNGRSLVIGQMGDDSMVTLNDWIYKGGGRMHIDGLKSIAKAYIKQYDTIYGYSEKTQKSGIRNAIMAQTVAETEKVCIAILEDGSRVALSGTLAWGGYLLEESAQVRTEYISATRELPIDSTRAVRAALKKEYRLKTPRPMREIIERVRPGTGPKEDSGCRVNATNPKADAVGRTIGRVGKALTVAVVAIEVYNIYNAPEGRNLQYTAGASGRIMGAIAGGKAGAWAGVKVGTAFAVGAGQAGPQAAAPEEVVTVPIGAVIGGFVGGVSGSISGAYIGGAITEEAYILITPEEGRY